MSWGHTARTSQTARGRALSLTPAPANEARCDAPCGLVLDSDSPSALCRRLTPRPATGKAERESRRFKCPVVRRCASVSSLPAQAGRQGQPTARVTERSTNSLAREHDLGLGGACARDQVRSVRPSTSALQSSSSVVFCSRPLSRAQLKRRSMRAPASKLHIRCPRSKDVGALPASGRFLSFF